MVVVLVMVASNILPLSIEDFPPEEKPTPAESEKKVLQPSAALLSSAFHPHFYRCNCAICYRPKL